MVITYYGLSCFKVQSGDMTLAFDPPSKGSDLKPPRFEANVVLSSHNHPGHNGLHELSAKKPARNASPASNASRSDAGWHSDAGGEGGPFLVSGPGEYEIEGLAIYGIASFHDSEKGKKLGFNTIYTVEFENIKLCHLGDLGESDIDSETLEALGEIDVLFLPVGGKDVLDAEAAVKILNKIEPKAVIPMHYSIPKTSIKGARVEEFLKELGEEKIKPEEKFTFKKKDLPEEGLKIVLLEPSINL